MVDSRQVGAVDSGTAITRDGPVAAGDYLTAFVARSWDSNADPISMPGWEPLGDSADTGNEWTPVTRVFARWATADEPASWSVNASSGVTAVVLATTGVDTAAPLARTPVFSAGGRSSGQAPSLTPDAAPARVLWMLTHQNWNADANTTVTWTGASVAAAITPTFVNISVAYADQADTTPTGTRDWTITPWNGNTDALTAALALRHSTSDDPEPELEPDPEPEPAPDPMRPAPPTLVEPATAALPEWSFVLGPATGGLLRELTVRSRKCSFKLAEPSEASCEVDGRSPTAAVVDELSTDLFVYRAPTIGARKLLLYRGRISNVSDTFDATQHTVTIPSLDYRAVLARRLLMSGSQQTWTQQDQAAIAYGLIQQAQRLAPSYGIVPGVGAATGVKRDRSYDLGDSIGDRIQELSEVVDGFDWDITPTSATDLALDIWYPQRGVVQPIILEYGGAVVSGSRNVDSKDYANHVRVTGTQPEGGGAEPAIQERVADGVATRPEGRWDNTYGESITTTAALEERADWQIDHAQVITPSYTLKLRTGWWRGPGHLWLGDTVSVRIKTGRLRVNTQLRVHQIDVDIADDGTEDVSLTVGGPKPDYRRRAADVEKRLALLERR